MAYRRVLVYQTSCVIGDEKPAYCYFVCKQAYQYYPDELFPEVYVILHVRRKYMFFVTYIIFPCLLLSGVLLMVFLLPADSGEKVSLGVSILIAISVFLLLVSSSVPNSSDSIPLLGQHVPPRSTYSTVVSILVKIAKIRIIYNMSDDM